ncbi:MAG: hypothetical protein K6G79_08260 [Bacteroidales bacterium]|nr:hypothetical protein [Bacteroidales bacterium]
MARKRRSSKHSLSPDYRREALAKLVRKHRKTILFNERELSLISKYCDKYSITNKSAFIRDIVISHIMKQMDDDYPRLF